MTKQINLVINGKGGVGKSFFATNLVQYLKDRGHVHRAIEQRLRELDAEAISLGSRLHQP